MALESPELHQFIHRQTVVICHPVQSRDSQMGIRPPASITEPPGAVTLLVRCCSKFSMFPY